MYFVFNVWNDLIKDKDSINNWVVPEVDKVLICLLAPLRLTMPARSNFITSSKHSSHFLINQ